MDLLALFNILSLVVFVGLGLLAVFRMVWRLGNFIFYKLPVPVILKRDVFLFLSWFGYFGTILLALLSGWTNLSHEPLWLVPRGIVVLSAMAYWVWVEYHLDDTPKKG